MSYIPTKYEEHFCSLDNPLIYYNIMPSKHFGDASSPHLVPPSCFSRFIPHSLMPVHSEASPPIKLQYEASPRPYRILFGGLPVQRQELLLPAAMHDIAPTEASPLELNCRRNCMTAIQKRGFASQELINTRCQYNRGASPHGLSDFPWWTSVKSTVLFLSAELPDNKSTVRLRPTPGCNTRLRPGLTEFYSEDFQRRDRYYYCRLNSRWNCLTAIQKRLCLKGVNQYAPSVQFVGLRPPAFRTFPGGLPLSQR